MTKSELKSRAKAAGSHYFDRDTMRFFNSKLISVYEGPNGVYFVTYERGPHGPGAYSVRHFTGKSVDTVGAFMGHNKPDAQQKAKALAGRVTRVKRSKPLRHSPKRSKSRRGVKRRTLTRLRRVRLAAARRGWGVLRGQGRGTPFTLHPSVGDRVSWISRPWGMRVHGIVTGMSSSGQTLSVTQSNGTGGVINASDVLAVNKREMLR